MKIVLLLLVSVAYCNCSIDLSISCSGDTPSISQPQTARQIVGAPGKRGPAGPSGPKGSRGAQGEPGSSCECPDIQQLKEQFAELQKLIRPRDCSETIVQANGVYKIYPLGYNTAGIDVLCDENWTIIQRRMDGSVSFDRTYSEYQRGFGSASGEYWLGLDLISNFTATGQYELLIKLEDKQGNKAEAKYSSFSIGPRSDNYRLSVSGYSGNASDSLDTDTQQRHNGQQFATPDVNDVNGCAKSYTAGWWYNACHRANLNGIYTGHGTKGITWFEWKKDHEPLKAVSMQIKRKTN